MLPVEQAALSFPISVPENGHLALTAFQQTADVFLVGENNQQGYAYGEDPIGMIMDIEYHQYKNREGSAG